MLIRSDLFRFGVVSVVGLGLDLLVAWGLAVLGGLPLPAAAVFGFLAGAVLNYVLHERWTFGPGGRLSARRGGLYALSLGVTLAIRVASVAVLEWLVFPAPGQELATLVAATGLSFLTNYLLSKHVVFRPGATRGVDSTHPTEPS